MAWETRAVTPLGNPVTNVCIFNYKICFFFFFSDGGGGGGGVFIIKITFKQGNNGVPKKSPHN